jgi:hypothetical protein
MARWLGGTVARRRGDVVALVAVVAAAILMLCSGLIHIHLWDIAYRHVATLGPLFLVQAVAALVLAVVLVAVRVVVVALACIVLMLGTVVGFILADTVGLFGFTLSVVTGWAYEALVCELLSALLLSLLVLRSWRAAARDAAWAAEKAAKAAKAAGGVVGTVGTDGATESADRGMVGGA